MMKMTQRILIISLLVLVAAALFSAPIVAAAPAARSLGGTVSVIPRDLPVKKMPVSLSAASPSSFELMGVPPGQAKKPPSTTSSKWAVVIGIADYQGTENDLWNPDSDAMEMVQALTTNYGFPSRNIKLLLNGNATASAIASALDWLVRNEKCTSTVVFFYSGHGFQKNDSDGWDTDIELDGIDEGIVSYDMYGLTDGYLKAKLAALESKKIALCFGSCFSGGMFDDNDDLQGPNRIIAAACAANEYGYDYLYLENTLWGKGFVDDVLLNKTYCALGNGVSIEDAHEYCALVVPILQPDSNPQISDNYSGEFIP